MGNPEMPKIRSTCLLIAALAVGVVFQILAASGQVCAGEIATADPAETKTEWRNDVANLEAVQKINEAYRRMPFSVEYEGVSDDCPLLIDWQLGPNLPHTWKGGVAAFFGDEIVLAGGLWMPMRANFTYAYNTKTGTYRQLPPARG